MATSPARPLMHEHGTIHRVLGFLKAEAEAIDEGAAPRHSLVDQAAVFMLEYADPYHHGKEELILFPRVADKQPTPDLMAEMNDLVREHGIVRTLTASFADTNRRHLMGDETAAQELADTLRELSDIYGEHMRKEDRHFFKAALDYFTAEEQAAMVEDFAAFDRQLVHEHYESVAEDLHSVSFVPSGTAAGR